MSAKGAAKQHHLKVTFGSKTKFSRRLHLVKSDLFSSMDARRLSVGGGDGSFFNEMLGMFQLSMQARTRWVRSIPLFPSLCPLCFGNLLFDTKTVYFFRANRFINIHVLIFCMSTKQKFLPLFSKRRMKNPIICFQAYVFSLLPASFYFLGVFFE